MMPSPTLHAKYNLQFKGRKGRKYRPFHVIANISILPSCAATKTTKKTK
jgi:hypothetical protein